MISGLGKIDIDDWKAHTRLKHCSNDTTIVKWFWRTVDDFDEEKRARLLQFVTGSSRVPLQGFKALQGMRSCLLRLGFVFKSIPFAGSTGSQGPRLFTIHQVDTNTDNLPKAHTWSVGLYVPYRLFLAW
jgi:E3 ubiquitin ligase SMURF1/2